MKYDVFRGVTNVDLNKLKLSELTKLQMQIEDRLVQLEVEERQNALDAARRAAREFGFTLEDLLANVASGKTSRRPAENVNPPKFANPENKAQTWSGRGRRPAWFVAALDAGKTPEQMEI